MNQSINQSINQSTGVSAHSDPREAIWISVYPFIGVKEPYFGGYISRPFFLIQLGKTLDTEDSSITSMYDVNKTQKSILKIP